MLGTDQLVAPPTLIAGVLDGLHPLCKRDFTFTSVHTSQNSLIEGFSFLGKPAITEVNVINTIRIKMPHIIRCSITADKQMEKVDDGAEVVPSNCLDQLLCQAKRVDR